MRQLSEDERAICLKSITRIIEEVIDLEQVLIPEATLTYEKILDYNHKINKNKTKELISQYKQDLKSKQEQIKILEDQINNGVQEKQIKSGNKKEVK